MAMIRNILNPPPTQPVFETPVTKPLVLRRSDLVWLGLLSLLLFGLATLAGIWVDPSMGILVWLGGSLLVLESWVTGVNYLNRHPMDLIHHRWTIFLAALIPWMIGLSVAAGLMVGLFLISDWCGFLY